MEVKEADVVRGLKTLVHNLSKAHHYLVAGSTPGIHIGGDPATTATLAMCMLHLQHAAYSDLDLIVTDARGDEKCWLSAGAVHPMGAAAGAAP